MKRMAFTKKEWSWIAYDMGNSAYSMAITSALLPIYFGMFKPGDGMDIGYFASLASLIVAVLSPILGTLADFKGHKKRLFYTFSIMGFVSTATLALVPYYNWQLLIAIFIVTCIGFAGSNVFYDAFLVDVTEESRWDAVSANGFAYGYIASVLPFALCLVAVYLIGLDSFLGYQIGFVITGAWWCLLTIPMYRNVDQVYYVEPVPNPISGTFRRIYKTLRSMREYRSILLFLGTYFLYIDGVDTIIRMVVPYSQGVLGTSLNTFVLLGILLIVQIIAFPFAILYGRLAQRFGAMRMIQFAIFTYMVAVFFAAMMSQVWHIFVLGILIASAQGGIQALSRSYFAKIIPKERSNEFFGFYNVFGKFAAIFGPMAMSLVNTITNSTRLSIFGILPLFVFGFMASLFLPKDSGETAK